VSGELETKAVPAADPLLNQADAARHAGSLLEAKELYLQILQQAPSTSMAATVQERLGEVNLRLIFSPTMTPDAATHVIEPGDTLSKIARKFHMTLELLMAANGLRSDRIRPGQRLKVVQANFSVVVDKSQNTLTLKQGEEVLKVYRCSTGQEGVTPIGIFKIANRIPNPPWFTPNGVIPSDDPRNILGSRWMGFDLLPSYGIHGTTDPASIGKPVTQGCVRLANADVEELYTLLPVGTQVNIVE
jgi:lipoprotein-anchoring transpeptidase ErfK/SrfK